MLRSENLKSEIRNSKFESPIGSEVWDLAFEGFVAERSNPKSKIRNPKFLRAFREQAKAVLPAVMERSFIVALATAATVDLSCARAVGRGSCPRTRDCTRNFATDHSASPCCWRSFSLLGYLSVRRMDDVSFRVLDLEHQHAAKLGLLLQLRLGLTKLNNEARARQEAEARRELKPPFDFRLSLAREEVNQLLGQLERPPLSEDPAWRRFRDDLQSYVEVTEDLRRYSFEGFSKFRVVDEELDGLLTASTIEQSEIFRQSEAIEQEATRSIRLWSVMALLVGAMVAAGTIWEVQRRFRQMRRSMFEARRERTFTNQLLEGMVSAVAAIDEHNRIRSANAAFFKIFPGRVLAHPCSRSLARTMQ